MVSEYFEKNMQRLEFIQRNKETLIHKNKKEFIKSIKKSKKANKSEILLSFVRYKNLRTQKINTAAIF